MPDHSCAEWLAANPKFRASGEDTLLLLEVGDVPLNGEPPAEKLLEFRPDRGTLALHLSGHTVRRCIVGAGDMVFVGPGSIECARLNENGPHAVMLKSAAQVEELDASRSRSLHVGIEPDSAVGVLICGEVIGTVGARDPTVETIRVPGGALTLSGVVRCERLEAPGELVISGRGAVQAKQVNLHRVRLTEQGQLRIYGNAALSEVSLGTGGFLVVGTGGVVEGTSFTSERGSGSALVEGGRLSSLREFMG